MKKGNIIGEDRVRTLKAGGISFRLHCCKCGHDWEDGKYENPKACPECHSVNYNKQSSAKPPSRLPIKVRKLTMPTPEPEPMPIPEPELEKAKVKKTYTLRFYMMILSGAAITFGLALFVIYFLTTNLILGGPGVIFMVAGIFIFRYYWKKEGEISVEYIGEAKRDKEANSLNLYRDKVKFDEVYNPEGFPWECGNDKKRYFVNIWNEETQRLEPFILPDQQYLEPIVFAQRVLGLPAHRKIFERKPKLIQKLKTALLVLAIGIVWLLILTTTGG